MTWFDRALATVAPRMALKRLQYQAAVRSYDGAASSRRTSGWSTVATSANAETFVGSRKLRFNGRDLERNNAWAAKAIQVITSNTVGAGILCQPKGPNRAKTARAMALWRGWAETKACDWDGRHDLYGLQAIAMQTIARDGEVLVRFRRTTGAIPLQIQLLEPDFLCLSQTSGEGGNTVVQGIEIDTDGRAVAYWLYDRHPGDYYGAGWGKSWLPGTRATRIPVEQIARVYRQDRAGQLRGVSWLAPVVLPLRDLDDYEDAQLMRQKVAACFAAFVHDANGADGTDTPDDELTDKIEPGIIQTLPPGKEITFADPPSLGGYGEFTRGVLHKVAAGLGITYESLTGDLSQTNFSSARMGWIEMGRLIDAWRWRMLIPQLCGPVWAQFAMAAELGTGLDMTGIVASWTPPRRELINPKDDIAAIRDGIRSGLTTWSESVRELGFDPAAQVAEMQADLAAFDAAGLVLDCDPRKTTQQGMPRVKETETVTGLPPEQ